MNRKLHRQLRAFHVINRPGNAGKPETFRKIFSFLKKSSFAGISLEKIQ
jgi:hypothetical protein